MQRNCIRHAIRTMGVAFALAATFAAPVHAKEWKSVTIAFEYGNPPWNFNDPPDHGIEMHGFEPELAANLCERAKLKCTLTAGEWKELVPGLQAGKFDVVMDQIEIPSSLQKVIDFSKPYTRVPATFAVVDDKVLPKAQPNAPILELTGDPVADKPAIDSLRKLFKGKSIGIVSGVVYEKFLNDNFKDVATIRTYDSSTLRDLDLIDHEIDAVFDDISTFASDIEYADKNGIHVAGPEIRSPRWGAGEAMGLRKEDADLRARFDAAITAALADGTVKKLSEKWFHRDITP